MARSVRAPAAASIVLVLLLAACAPTVVGSRATPYDLRAGASARVAPGGSVYAAWRGDASAFGFTSADFPGLFVPCGGDRTCAVVTRAFELVDVVAPIGWTWRVDRADAVRRPRAPVALEIVLRLDVPAEARLGGTQLRARLRADTGTTLPVAQVVQVVR